MRELVNFGVSGAKLRGIADGRTVTGYTARQGKS